MTSYRTHFEFLQFDSLEQSFRSSLLWRMLVCLLVHLSIFSSTCTYTYTMGHWPVFWSQTKVSDLGLSER